jgi:hypothetical protein
MLLRLLGGGCENPYHDIVDYAVSLSMARSALRGGPSAEEKISDECTRRDC